jgi:hypothetical protein
MALSTAILVGAVAALVVPWVAAGKDPPILAGTLDGREVPLSLGSHYVVLHWSWLVFFAVTVVAYLLLRASEQSG